MTYTVSSGTLNSTIPQPFENRQFAFWLCCRKAKLAELTGWSLSDKCHMLPVNTSYKDCCRRCCEIVGSGASGRRAVDLPVCTNCHKSICTCTRSTSHQNLHEELIVFDFGSKTTWFKYTGDAGIGQLSMHPTVRPLNGSSALSDGFCPVCTKTSMQHLQLAQREEAVSYRKSSKTFSKQSLLNLDCFGSFSSREDDDAECMRLSSVDPRPNASSVDEQMPVSAPGDVQLFEFLMRHIIKRNPCFQISNIPFVICQSTDADELTKNKLIRMLICHLKVPE